MAVAGKTLKMRRNGTVPLSLWCPVAEPGGCEGTLSVQSRKLKLGKATFVVGGGKNTQLQIKLSKRNRLLVRRLRKVQVLVVVTARDKAGNTNTMKRTLILKA
jgi:hypothetical protein